MDSRHKATKLFKLFQIHLELVSLYLCYEQLNWRLVNYNFHNGEGRLIYSGISKTNKKPCYPSLVAALLQKAISCYFYSYPDYFLQH